MKIKGSISQLLRGLENPNVDKESLIGLPINDEKGKRVGTIVGVDLNGDTWFGEVN